MKNILPLIDTLMAKGWIPDLLLLQSDHDKVFARLTSQLKKGESSDFNALEKLYTEVLSGYSDFKSYNADSTMSAEASQLLETFYSPYTKTKSAPERVRFSLPCLIGRSYAERFYEMAVTIDMQHCLLWMKNEEERLRNDDDMKQVVRETLAVVAGYCRRIHHAATDDSQIYTYVLRKLTCLYFEIVHSYLEEHTDWKEYISTSYPDSLPLSFFEFTSTYWNEMPSEGDEDLWEKFSNSQAPYSQETKPEKLAPTGEEAYEKGVIDKYNHFLNAVEVYKFLDCPKMACLTKIQRGMLIRNIVNSTDKYGAYAIAMLCHLDYDKWIFEQFSLPNPHPKMTKTAIYRHWCEALSLSNERAVRGNYSLIRNPDSKEDKDKYKAYEYTHVVKEDYEKIKKS